MLVDQDSEKRVRKTDYWTCASQSGWLPTTRRLRVCYLGLAIALLAAPLHGETKISFRQLTRTFPVAVQRGTSVTVEVSSNFSLDGSHSVFFVPPGPRMEFGQEQPKSAEWKEPAEEDLGTSFHFQADVPADQMPGIYEYRIATSQAVSSVAHLLVTDYPVAIEQTDDNDVPQLAQRIQVPAAVCGTVERFEDVDHYRIEGQAGDDLVCQIFAQRVTESIHCMAIRYPKIHLMDSMLTLFGPSGQVIAQNDNFAGGDALLHCTLPVTGDYVLEVRDTRYAGDPRYTYCVEVAHRPHAYGLLPMAVQSGQSAAARIIQSQAENTTPHRNAVDPVRLDPFSAQAPGWHQVRLRTAQGISNPVHLLVSPDPQIVAPRGNGTPATAWPIQLPAGISGLFSESQQTHYYRFRARQDLHYRFEVQAQRRGFATDSVISVHDESGKVLASGDDGHYTKDAQLTFKAPADGVYLVSVRDLHGRGGDQFAYHLSAATSGPDFEIHGEYYYGMLAPGGSAIWFVSLKRLHGFDGPVEMSVQGLPDGVSFTPVTIPAGMNHCSLIFTAAQDAPVNADLLRVSGRAQLPRPDGKTIEAVRHANITCELRRAGASRFVRGPIHTQLLGVTHPLDLTAVRTPLTEITLRRGQRAEILVNIERSPEYTDQVLLDMAFSFFTVKYGQQLPPGVTMSSDSQTKLTDGNLQGRIFLEASRSALLVDRLPIAALARVPITYSIMTNYATNPIYLTVTE